ncbi:hypothetical protein ED733_000196 [Metarhizium rileyi]|uniref:Uncharacterized protein n=1 Tax=Metarhizium rileyi (strain RCEF 4871) TaxID=1649241 RepID=A0A5C6FYE4_METRR|nr:hypothetical protein ED733_000196 [Metarhizium rileyi]
MRYIPALVAVFASATLAAPAASSALPRVREYCAVPENKGPCKLAIDRCRLEIPSDQRHHLSQGGPDAGPTRDVFYECMVRRTVEAFSDKRKAEVCGAGVSKDDCESAFFDCGTYLVMKDVDGTTAQRDAIACVRRHLRD